MKAADFNETKSYLRRRAFNDNGCLLVHADNSSGMTQQLQAVLKECRLHRNKLFKLLEGDGFLQQLVTAVMWKVSQDELTWVRHEVVLIQLIADDISGHLSVNRIRSTKLVMTNILLIVYFSHLLVIPVKHHLLCHSSLTIKLHISRLS